MRRHSILFLNRVYPPAEAASGQLLKQLAGKLAQAGWEVTVVTGRTDGAAQSETVAGVRVERVGSLAFARASHWRRTLSYLSLYPALLWRALRLPRAEVVVTMTDPPLLLALGPVLKWCKGSKLLHWAQDFYPEPAEKSSASPRAGLAARMLRRMSTAALRRIDRIVATSQGMKARLGECGISAESIDVIPNWSSGGADTFTEVRERISEMIVGASLDRAVDAFELTLDEMHIEAGRRTELSAIQFGTSPCVRGNVQKAA